MFDVIIIGGGPAGLTAAIYLGRKKMKILLLTIDTGGQTAKAASVENYPGLDKISGIDLSQKMMEQVKNLEVEVRENLAVKSITKNNNGFEIKTDNEKFQARATIICSGKVPKKLNVPGENALSGNGISTCATCDGPLFSDKKVAVIGGGNSALDAAIELEKYASEVTILNIGPQLQGDAVMVEKFKKSPKSKIINQAKTLEVIGKDKVEKIKYQVGNQVEELAVEGVFVEVGWTPATDFVKDLVKLNKPQEIEVDSNQTTSCEGVFAAGDVTDTPFKQIVIAAGSGAKAALSAWKFLITNPK